VRGRAPLSNGATICVLGRLNADNSPEYWELTFRDPQATHPNDTGVTLLYDQLQARLFRISSTNQHEISNLRPQEHRLVRFMAERNRAASGLPTLCRYDELMSAVWGTEPGRSEAEINHLVHELRRKIEPDPRSPIFLETVRGLGYRLIIRVVE
jgi:DNA-binding response OmpR family regulator